VEINQLLAVAAYGDATTNEAMRLQRIFRQSGPSHIFSFRPPDPRLSGVQALSAFESAAGRDSTLLLHFSMGQPELFDFVTKRPERLLLRYHNVTPPELFQDFDPTFAAQLAAGRREVAALKDRVTLAVADSTFNAQDLVGFGYRSPVVVPLVLDLDGLVNTRPRQPSFPLPEPGPPVIAFVGRIAPNKGHPQLLQAFHVLKTYLRPDAFLVIIGSPHHVGYLQSLERFIQELRLNDVVMPGQVSDPELAAVYRRADVFLCLSEHEGFGVPLVEAMAFGVPVVAKAAAAVPETVGGAGILLPDSGPALVAEAVNRVLEDRGLRARLAARGRERLAELRPDDLGRRIREHILAASA
jgi:glycosyltransferase involved in cell wall biosynthesis